MNISPVRTLKAANAILNPLGVKVAKKEGEFRVSFRNDSKAEASAYYTTCILDAVATGKGMAERREKLDRIIKGWGRSSEC